MKSFIMEAEPDQKRLFVAAAILVLLFVWVDRSYGEKISTPQAVESSDLFTVTTLVNGRVLVYKNSRLVADLLPEVFVQDRDRKWKYRAFKAWGKDTTFNAMAQVGVGQVGLVSAVTVTDHEIHISYQMAPLDDVTVIDVRAALFTPYQDWVDSIYQHTSDNGVIPAAASPAKAFLSFSGPETMTLNPTAQGGWKLQCSSVGLRTRLVDDRQYGPDLLVEWDHQEPSAAPWVWKKGDIKTFDITLSTDRTWTPSGVDPSQTSTEYWYGFYENPKTGKERISARLDRNNGKVDVHYSLVDEGLYNFKSSRLLEMPDLSKVRKTDQLELGSSGELFNEIDSGKNRFWLRQGVSFMVPRLDVDGHPITQYTYQPPPQMTDGLEAGDIRQSPLNLEVLTRGMDRILDQSFPNIRSLVIVQNDQLLMDEYFYGYTLNDEQKLHSVTKSILSTLFGIAADRGLVTVDQRLYDFFPEFRKQKDWDPRKNSITLGMVLTMNAGFACDDYVEPLYRCEQSLLASNDWIDYALSVPLDHAPGTFFKYCNYCLLPLGEILKRATGMSVPDFAQRNLYAPLGIEASRWREGPNGVVEVAGSHWLRPRDMAKLGLLFLHQGNWQGQQIVSKKWVQAATSPEAAGNEGKDYDYGYFWWEEKTMVGNNLVNFYYAKGHGGQYIFVVPDLKLVCVMTAGNSDGIRLLPLPEEFFEAYVLGAFQ